MCMLSLETIMSKTLWVAKMNGFRKVGTYEEVKSYGESEECRDFDICANQPEELKPFYDKYFAHQGFITVQDFYNNIYSKTAEKEKRVWTREEIENLVQTNDKVLYGALKQLYECQTKDEQNSETTKEQNGVGFNAFDAPILSSLAEGLKKYGSLTVKQRELARKKLKKYTKQLTVLANS